MDRVTDAQVRQRARERCEYCRLSQKFFPFRFHIDHVIARQHRGSDELSNLALACPHCNFRKGPNIAGVDPLNGTISRLFHPRKDLWIEHFVMHGPYVEGLTEVGRTTVSTLEVNDEDRIALREVMIEELGSIE